MAELIIINEWHKFEALKIPYDQPYFEQANVLKYSREIEESCQKNKINYYCLEKYMYEQMVK